MKNTKLHLAKRFLHLTTLLLLIVTESIAQSPVFLGPCAKAKEPNFEFGPPRTLCYRYSHPDPSEPQPAAFVIGSPGRQFSSQVIAILGSNQLPGIVHVVGNFTIDADFTFGNAVMFISPNVRITVNESRELTLDNAKLFCCNGMWQGIVLELGAIIETDNVTEIEDAWFAIDEPCRGTVMRISNTIFNRNFVGIRVGHWGNVPNCINPILLTNFAVFTGNTFSCTQALNTPTEPVGLAGIQILENANLRIGQNFSAPSTFRDIQFGGLSEATTNTILVSRCNFEGLLNEGIHQESGTLTAQFCNFTNCFANGIHQAFTRNLTVSNCGFIYNGDLDGTATDFHNGIFATQFGMGALVSINNSDFEISHAVADGISSGIYLNGGNDDVSTETRIVISNNDFSVQTGRCIGIYMEGDFANLLPGASSIFNNNFTLFNHNSYAELKGMWLQGEFQRFSIQSNDFFGLQRQDNTLNSTCSLQFFGTGNSFENEISHNIWHIPDLPTTIEAFRRPDLFFSLRISNQDMGSICYNQFFNVAHAGSLNELGHSTYSNNIFGLMAHGPRIESGMIGVQPHQGNRWVFPSIDVDGDGILEPPFDINQVDGYHIRCSGPVAASFFEVHTPQATQLYDVAHPFHPFVIIPDLDNEFFNQTEGTPQECVLDGLLGDVPDMDKWLADGNTSALQGMDEADIWQNQRHLYRLLQADAEYYASYSGFPGFVAQHQNGNIGKFYQINSLLAQSATVSEALASEVSALQQQIADNIEEVDNLDNQLQGESNPATIAALMAAQSNASEGIVSAQGELKNLQTQYDAPRSTYYQQAQSINNSVNAVGIFEANEKAVNQVMLNALINQSGNLTEQDAQMLKGIASQCPKTGGTAVIKARMLLEDCHEDVTDDYTVECEGEFSTQSTLSYAGENSPRNQAVAQTATVFGDDIFLDVLFVEGSRYLLYDLNGRELLSGKLDASLRIQIPSGLAPGVYVCTVAYPSGVTTSQKVVIAR